MSDALINRLKKVLTDIQLSAYIDYTAAFNAYRVSRADTALNAYEAALAKFLSLTDGKLPCELIPITVW